MPPGKLRSGVSKLIDAYRQYALDHGRNTLEGDAAATNLACDRLQDIFAAILKTGEGSELFHLYDDVDAWVQSWAASHTLEIDGSRPNCELGAAEIFDFR
jgi:hypothetical protein